MALPRGEALEDPEQLASQCSPQGSTARRHTCLCCHLVTHSGTTRVAAIPRSCHLRQFQSPPDVQNFPTHQTSNLHVEMELPGENTWVSCLSSHSAVVREVQKCRRIK